MKKLMTALIAGAVSMSAQAFDVEFNFGFGFSDEAVAEYSYTDGSTQRLDFGDGVEVLVGHEIFQRGPIAIDLRGGFHLGFIAESEGSTTLSDFFNYFPMHANVKYAFSDSIKIGGGVSYLFAPKYSGSENDLDYAVTGKNSLGFNVSGEYWMLPTSTTEGLNIGYTVRYTTGVFSVLRATNSNGLDQNVEGQIEDQSFGSLALGINLAF